MELANVHAMLQNIYAVDTGLEVKDFLVTDPDLIASLDNSHNARECDEKLLVSHQDGELLVSLFIDRTLLSRLATDDPWNRLHESNLADFCIALEGVSHFLYLTHRAQEERAVTLMELELQAEVDKYVSVHAMLNTQGAGAAPRALIEHLFDHVEFDERLDPRERSRYADANHFAKRYCGHLERTYLSSRSPQEVWNELRRFYRLSHTDKLRHIGACH